MKKSFYPVFSPDRCTRADAIYFAVLFAVGVLIHWHFKSGVIISNSDDALSLYRGFISFKGDTSSFLNATLDLAKSQGRFYFIVTDFFSMAPYLIEQDWARSLLNSVVFVGCGFSLAFLCYVGFSNVTLCKLFLILYLTVIPVYGAWWTYYHWPLYWLLPIILFSLSLAIWLNLVRATNSLKIIGLSTFYLCTCFSAVLFSEMYFVVFGIIMLLLSIRQVLIGHNVESGSRFFELLVSRWRVLVVTFLPFFAFFFCYVLFQIQIADSVNRVSSKLALNPDPLAFLSAYTTFFTSALPINSSVLSQANLYASRVDMAGGQNSEPLIALSALLVALLFLSVNFTSLLGQYCDRIAKGNPDFGARKSIVFGISLCLLPVVICSIFVSIHSLTYTYQNWLKEYVPWYSPGFFLSCGLLISGCLLLLFGFTRLSSRSQTVASVAIAVLLFLVMATASFSTLFVKDRIKNRNVVWHLLYQLADSPARTLIENDALVQFDALKPATGHRTPQFVSDDLINIFVGKKVRLFREDIDVDSRPDWVINIQERGKFSSAFLTLGKPVSWEGNQPRYSSISIIPLAGKFPRVVSIRGKSGCNLEIVKAKGYSKGFSVHTQKTFRVEDITFGKRNTDIAMCGDLDA